MPRQQRPGAGQLAQQKGDTRILVPLGIAAKAEVIGYFAHGPGVARRVLTHIEPHQKQPEGHGAAQAVEQWAVSDHAHAAFMQRLETQLQRLEQVAIVVQHVFARWLGVYQRGMGPVARRPQAFAQLL